MDNEITEKKLIEIFKVDSTAAKLALDLIDSYKPKKFIDAHPNCFPKTHDWIRKCYNEPPAEDQRMEALNEILDCHGVEGLFVAEESPLPSDFFGSYLNTGDTYSPTLCLVDGELKISSWGDEVEAKQQELAEEKKFWNNLWSENK